MRLINELERDVGYDAVVVGSGFGSMFFLQKFLQRRPRARVLILEWGAHNTHRWQLENHRNSPINNTNALTNRGDKPWLFSIGVGGGTNCWWGLSPRLHPSDFEMKSRYGVGVDWPVKYDELVPYYEQAERTMLVAGPEDLDVVYPGARFPARAHNMTTADRMLKAAAPDKHFAIPSARLRDSVGSRGACCANARCNLCPQDAKFTALNSLNDVFDHPSVDIMADAKVERLDVAANVVTGVIFNKGGREQKARGELVVLGANAIYSPWIMLRSGLRGHGLGRYLCEKMMVLAEVKLSGLKHFDGGTATTGFNISLLDGEHRRTRGSAFVLVENRPLDGLRPEWGRWRETMPMAAYIEDIPREECGVSVGEGPYAIAEPFEWSDYAVRGREAFLDNLPELLRALPVESITYRGTTSACHIQCTTRMGASVEDSVVDSNLIHHDIRNLVVVGNSVFPTVGSANPSLTTAALSLRAADKLMRSAA
jgi:choline dehydrogenase-like flavoprotein